MADAARLICPKCESEMRSYERNGILVDQCVGCKGVFLDRGELERLVDAEAAHHEEGEPGGQRGLVDKVRERAEMKMRQRGQRGEREERGEGGIFSELFGGE